MSNIRLPILTLMTLKLKTIMITNFLTSKMMTPIFVVYSQNEPDMYEILVLVPFAKELNSFIMGEGNKFIMKSI